MNNREWPDRRWCGAPLVLADEAMEDWVVMVRACRPWNGMFLDDVGGEFRAVFGELLYAGDDRAPDVRATRLRHLARAHGAFRRRQRCPALVLSEEVAFGEEAIAAALLRTGAAPEVVAIVQESFTPLLRAIERASYSGYVDWSERPAPGL